MDLGRDIDLIAGVARRSRVHVIVATGVWWMPQRYFSAHGVDDVAALFIRDITEGIGTSGVKAAIIKCATDTAGVTPVIENILRASARAQKATGVPISTHTWAAGRTGEAQQAIFAQEGVDLSRVIIGHSGDSDDLRYLRGLMERGSTIGMDRFGLEHFLPTEAGGGAREALRGGLRGPDGALPRRQLLVGHAVGRGQAADAAEVELQSHPGRHPARAAQGGGHRGADRPDAGAQPPRDLRGAEAGEVLMLFTRGHVSRLWPPRRSSAEQPWRHPPTARGHAQELELAGYAKVLCSAVFVSGRDPAEAAQNSGYVLMPRRARQGHLDVDREQKLVRMTLDGVTREARFYGDQGCIIQQPERPGIFFKPVAVKTTLPDAMTQPVADGRSAAGGAAAARRSIARSSRPPSTRRFRSRRADGRLRRRPQRAHHRRALHARHHEGHAARELVDGQEHHRDALRAARQGRHLHARAAGARVRWQQPGDPRAARSATSICCA